MLFYWVHLKLPSPDQEWTTCRLVGVESYPGWTWQDGQSQSLKTHLCYQGNILDDLYICHRKSWGMNHTFIRMFLQYFDDFIACLYNRNNGRSDHMMGCFSFDDYYLDLPQKRKRRCGEVSAWALQAWTVFAPLCPHHTTFHWALFVVSGFQKLRESWIRSIATFLTTNINLNSP